MPRWPKRKKRAGVDEYGRNALWVAAFKGELDTVKNLIAAGVNPNDSDDSGYGPLHVAIQEKHFEVIEYLLLHGADPNLKDKNGNVPLWVAISNWDRTNKIIILLLQCNADPTTPNNVGNRPCDALVNVEGEIAVHMKKWL